MPASTQPPRCRIQAPLDPNFFPAVLGDRDAQQKPGLRLVVGLERESGLLSRYETVLDLGAPGALYHVERSIKLLLWARGGWKIHFGGPPMIGEHICHCYSRTGERRFDVELMERVYERSFEVAVLDARDVPPENERGATLGGQLDGCRIGFDLGASDYKVAAVKDGTVVYSDEFPWNPRGHDDPLYHYTLLNSGLKQAARHLPRVDAIGGSTAGVVIDNRIMVASLFRAVPADRVGEAKDLFLRLQQEWGVPVEVLNDGDVTALAGAMSLGENGILGVAMGSSQAAGFRDRQGRIPGWLNELAFAPVDDNPEAPIDEWSGDRGVGASYFSQQAVNRLLVPAGISLTDNMDLPERLKAVQELMRAGDERAARIYETIGVYLGYTIPLYAEFYDFHHLLVLGRVTTGEGGNVILQKAREVLQQEFPELADKIAVHLPDEKSRRVGQAVAAASLPTLTR